MKRIFTPGRKKIIYFDMNNTLVDQKKTFYSCFLEVLDEFSGRWAHDEEDWNPEAILEEYQHRWTEKNKIRGKSESITKEQVQQQCLQEAMDKFPINVNESFAKAFFSRMKELQGGHSRLFPDVRETLEKLTDTYILAMISNGNKDLLQSNLRRLELSEFFTEDCIFTSLKGDFKKPNPSIFLHALKAMGVKSGQAVMVGNSWRNDICGATQTGMDAVWIHPNHTKKMSQRKVGNGKVITIVKFKQLLEIF